MIKVSNFFCFIYSIFYAVFLILFVFGISKCDIAEWIRYCSLLLTITFIFQMIMLKKFSISLLSLSAIFITFTYIFHFSHVFLLSIGFDFGYAEKFLAINVYGIETFKEAVELSILSVYVVFMGVLFANLKKTKTKKDIENIKNEINVDKLHFALGVAFLVLSIPVDFIYIFLGQLRAMMASGYLAVHEYEVNYIARLISYLMMPGVFLIITSKQISRNKSKVILIIFIIYKLLSMLTGLRAYNLISIIVITLLYYKNVTNFKMKFRNICLLFILSIPLGALLISIRDLRVDGINIGLLFSEMSNIKNNIYLNLMAEFGITINLVSVVYQSITVPTGGSQIFSGIASIIPGISKIFDSINWDSMNIATALDVWKMGGSYIADFYFDFGYWGIIGCGIYGYLIHKINNFVEFNMSIKRYDKVALLIPVLVEIIFTVRSSTSKLPRMVVWYVLIYLFVEFIVKLVIRKKRSSCEEPDYI